MKILSDLKLIEEISTSSFDPELRELLVVHTKRLDEYGSLEIKGLVTFFVFEGCDSVADLNMELGFSIMANRFDGGRYEEPGFIPSWEFIDEHINWFELVYVLSDDGCGVVVFVSKLADPELLKMLKQYSRHYPS